jgi:hypothetical protein
VVLAPAQARRELVGRHASLIETLLVTPDGFVAQWSASGPTAVGALEVVLSLAGDSWRADGPFFTTAARDGVRLLHLTPAPEWSVREEHGALAVRATLGASEPARLLATGGDDPEAAAARMTRLSRGGEARAESDLVAWRTRGLATRTGVDDLDDGLAWAAARVDAAAQRGAVHDLAAGEPFPLDPDARRVWTMLGALAAGLRVEPAQAPGTDLELLAVARAAAWRSTRVRPDVIARRSAADVEVHDSQSGKAARAVVRRAALLALADAIEPWQGKDRADRIRAHAASVASATPSGTTALAPTRARAVRLPTLGARPVPEEPFAAALAAALDLPDRPPYRGPAEDPPPGLLRALTAWACLNAGDLDRGFALFRRHLADGFAQGVGLWPDGSRIHDPAAAALVPLVFLDGLLGARADAHHGRLRLAPRLPPHWTRLAVSGIALGDAAVTLAYESAGGSHRFRIAQESGRVPVMLVFEPILAVSADAPVRIDGASASLDVTPEGGRARFRVQLPLDRERELSIG